MYTLSFNNLKQTFSAFSPPVWYHCFVSFNHLLLIVNASCNFLIYVSVGDKFKTTIDNFCHSILGCKKRVIVESDKNGLEEDDNEEKAAAIPLVKVDTAKNQMMITNNGSAKTNQVHFFFWQYKIRFAAHWNKNPIFFIPKSPWIFDIWKMWIVWKKGP